MKPSSAVLKSNEPVRRSLWIPALFVLGFLITITVNGVLIYTSISSFSGLETDSAYDKGIHYNQTLVKAAANAATGWRAESRISAGAKDMRKLEITVTDRMGAAVTALQVDAFLIRPTNAGMDDKLTLADLGGGRYGVEFSPKALGNWDLRLQARRDGTIWQQVQRIYFK